jgi:uncharacterized protein
MRMPDFVLSPSAARLVGVSAQGLLEAPARPAQKADVFQTIRELSALQIDTINVVARSPYLALFSRLGAYAPAWLDELLSEGQIFEYWAHAACFLPSEDYPFHRRMMLDGGRSWFSDEWRQENREVVDGVLETIRANGETRSADFERSDGRKGGWWDWKLEKRALEYWFGKGDLMVARRKNFQRIYDLNSRVKPDWDDSLAPAHEESQRALILKAVRALGVAKIGWVADYFRLNGRETLPRVRALHEEGRLLKLKVEGWEEPVYAHPDRRELIEAAQAGRLTPTRTTLLSPFDSLIWHRVRMRELFDYDFTIECYLPAAKRKYGYFLLPILHRGQLVGRLDAKAYRKEKLFEVRGLFLEPGVPADEELGAAVGRALRECAAWHGTPELVVRRCEPAGFLPLLVQ